jgi:hypothetical protein
MAEKSGFEALKTGSALLKKGTLAEKVEQRTVIKFCMDIGKTPTEMHKFLKQSEKHSKVSCSLIFKWHKRFVDGRDSLADDEREGRQASLFLVMPILSSALQIQISQPFRNLR